MNVIKWLTPTVMPFCFRRPRQDKHTLTVQIRMSAVVAFTRLYEHDRRRQLESFIAALEADLVATAANL